jgi:hypothetical protein
MNGFSWGQLFIESESLFVIFSLHFGRGGWVLEGENIKNREKVRIVGVCVCIFGKNLLSLHSQK